MRHWIPGKVIENKLWAQGLYSLYVEAKIAPFQAGQFAQLSLDPQGKVFRPYSFANAPQEPYLEFYYDVIDQGDFSPALARLQPGETIWLGEKAAGRFTLETVPPAKTLWLMATGTGLGVFLALLKTPEAWAKFEHIVLIHSVRQQAYLSHSALIQEWEAREGKRFRWLSIVTREEGGIFSKRLPDILESGDLEAYTGLKLSPETAQVMLCGNPHMLHEVSACLSARGMHPNRPSKPGHVTTEAYWK